MNIWKRWFSKRTGTAPQNASEEKCPFCGDKPAERSPSGTAYPVWDSACGAIGSGSVMYPDLDEVADGLLAILGIGGSVSEPSIPTGGSGLVSIQHYDIPKSLEQLQEILHKHGFEMQTITWNESGHQMHCIWIRLAVA